ncbi:ABC transporter ATP-binding protein [Blastococcus haudaquaticus]|uniref:ABC transporter ATP-binding protein n=1 Tax=Blastococcus haudaquaticus TaxID=1938745 RepID=UPI0013571178|nr:ATP-binding cassette domain-containing protein [Blastococcus haudaquaticus]
MTQAISPDRSANDSGGGAPPALVARGVGLSFAGLRALDDLAFEIPAGGTSAVIGPNGAGKTTLFNCISGLYGYEGELTLHGRPLGRLRPHQRARRGISRTFQTPALLDVESALQNVALGAVAHSRVGVVNSMLSTRRRRREERETLERAYALLQRLGIAALASRPVAGLAHGDRRRVEVARALLSSPSLLMLDEPAAGLGAEEAQDLLAEVEAYAGSDTTVLLVEHDVALVMSVARRVVVLDSGRLLAIGTPDEVRADPRVVEAYLGAEDADGPAPERLHASTGDAL